MMLTRQRSRCDRGLPGRKRLQPLASRRCGAAAVAPAAARAATARTSSRAPGRRRCGRRWCRRTDALGRAREPDRV